MGQTNIVCIGFMDGSVEIVDLNLFSQIPIKFEHNDNEIELPALIEGHTTAVCFTHFSKKFEGIMRGMRIPDPSDE